MRSARRLRWTHALVAVGLMLLLSGCAGDRLGPLEPATQQGDRMGSLWNVFVWVAAFVGILVWGLIGWSMLRYRKRREQEGLPPQFRYNTAIEIAYTAIPIVIVAVLFFLTKGVIHDVDSLSPNPDLVVEVTGFQWSWQFTYPEQGIVITGTPDEQPVMVLPVGETIRFELTSRDVIHSFFLPDFLEKRDVFPGMVEKVDVVVNEEGTYQGRCAEFCGTFHDRMLFQVRAVSPEEFDAWVQEETK
jgi:cytochrome c oxidase subunit II